MANENIMLADAVNASKLPATQKKALVERLSSFLCSHQAESVSSTIFRLKKAERGAVLLSEPTDKIMIAPHFYELASEEQQTWICGETKAF